MVAYYIYKGLKEDLEKLKPLSEKGMMVSFDTLNELKEAFNFLKDNFIEKLDESSFDEIQELFEFIDNKNLELFKDSPLVVYGVDEDYECV